LRHLRLADRVLLRKYGDSYFAYHAEKDELFELDLEAFNFLLSCDGGLKEVDRSIVEYLFSENLLEISSERKDNTWSEQEEPSLRYMLVTLTNRCNLTCLHCYVSQKNEFMSFETFRKAVDDFWKIGGLKLMISGGEPVMHPEFFEFLRYARKYPFRIVLLSNGYMIRDEHISLLSELVDEVQISLDGFEGHEILRRADWRIVLDRIAKLSEVMDVSVSTMVTRYNINEFERMQRILENLGILRWSIDVPTAERDVVPEWDVVREILSNYGFGEMGHESIQGYACGAHYCEVNPDGYVVKCGFFEESVGNVMEGLESCWERMKEKFVWKVEELECHCNHREECRGGCRYRALVYSGNLFLEDPVMCAVFGVKTSDVNSGHLNT